MAFEPVYPDSAVEPDESSIVPEKVAGEPTHAPRILTSSSNMRPPSETPRPEQTGSDSAAKPDEGARKTAIQARIDRLTRKTHQATSERDNLRDEVSKLREQIAALSQAPPARAPATAPRPTGPFGQVEDPAAAPSELPSTDIAGVVKAEIQKALAPWTRQAAEQARMSELRQAHEAAFAREVEEFPDLKNPDSDLRKVFNEIYDGRPDLQVIPDAPAIIANMARGVLADQRRAEQKQTAAKRTATVHAPIPQAAPLPEQALQRVAEKATNDAWDRMRNGVGGEGDYKLLRMAQRQRSGMPTD